MGFTGEQDVDQHEETRSDEERQKNAMEIPFHLNDHEIWHLLYCGHLTC